MGIIDLHAHSCCSDGTFTPGELVDYAIGKGRAETENFLGKVYGGSLGLMTLKRSSLNRVRLWELSI